MPTVFFNLSNFFTILIYGKSYFYIYFLVLHVDSAIFVIVNIKHSPPRFPPKLCFSFQNCFQDECVMFREGGVI